MKNYSKPVSVAPTEAAQTVNRGFPMITSNTPELQNRNNLFQAAGNSSNMPKQLGASQMQFPFCRLFVKAVIYADVEALGRHQLGGSSNAPEIVNLLVSLPYESCILALMRKV